MESTKESARTGSLPVVMADVEAPWHGVPTAIARRFHQICATKISEVLDEFDLTPLQYGAMLHLSRTTGTPGIEQNVLADRLSVDRNTASLLVEHLAKVGMVARQVNEADRRVRLLTLTTKGEKLYARLHPAVTAANENILAPITPRDRKLLIGLLIRVIEEHYQSRPTRRRSRSRHQSPATKA
jgi:DNA-binding MarR family transcriptional regulator